MTINEGLVPFNQMDPEEARKIQVMGGSVTGSPKKRLASRLRELKKKGLTDENCSRLYDIMTDPEMSALDIKLFIEKLKTSNLSDSEKIKVGNLMLSWHKANFGDKHLNLNVDADSFTVPVETYVKLRSAVMQVVDYKQFRQILDIIGEDNEPKR